MKEKIQPRDYRNVQQNFASVSLKTGQQMGSAAFSVPF
jgi:hypothetical protein